MLYHGADDKRKKVVFVSNVLKVKRKSVRVMSLRVEI